MRIFVLPLLAISWAAVSARGGLAPAPSASEAPSSTQLAFFEKNIRPVLASKCYKCHSAEASKAKGGLLLDSREGMLKGGDSGHAVVPGNLKESLLIKALRYHDKDMKMPPEKEGGQLPELVILDFERWITMGAPDPRNGSAGAVKQAINLEEGKKFWAFQAPKPSSLPPVQKAAWPAGPVDRYVLAAQEAKGLQPVGDAEPATLLRRVYFDLVGLPPSPAEVAAFLKDRSPNALATVVDRLLASPQFGERWGRHWLDVARYAESTGKERNFTFPTAWRYRDYVIDSFNADKPYDAFIREQIAGDLLPAANERERKEHTVATGFLALGAKSLQEKVREQFAADQIDEQIDTTTRAVLGLTVACARCHDHKFDPVPQRDYYSLSGIFRSTETFYGTSYVRKGQTMRNSSTLISLDNLPLQPAPAAKALTAAALESLLTPDERQRLAKLEKIRPDRAEQVRAMVAEKRGLTSSSAPKQPLAPVKGKQMGFAAPETGDHCMGVKDGRVTNSRLLVRGEVDQPSDSIPRGFVSVLAVPGTPAPAATQSGRLELAQWLTSPQNPLTARVAVNRIWQHLFGQGLVRTSDNFGASGERPSHPELLDYLALQFVGEGWSVKKMVRTLMLSHTYRLANASSAQGQELDPGNRLLWQASQRRLDAEAIRDAILAASGQLDLHRPEGSLVSRGGDAYIGKTVQPEHFSEAKILNRSVYLPIVRDYAPEVLELFDFAEPSLVIAARDVTNVPSQALFMMNNDFVREQADALAKRIPTAEMGDGPRISAAYRYTLGREPTAAERDRAFSYVRQATADLPKTKPELPYSSFCQALFASAEFRYVR